MNTKKHEFRFPDQFIKREEAYVMAGGRNAFESMAERYGIMPYPRYPGARATMYSLYEIQEAISKYKEDVRGEVQYRAKGA